MVELNEKAGERDRARLIHILVVHFDMFRGKAEEVADLFLHDKTLPAPDDGLLGDMQPLPRYAPNSGQGGMIHDVYGSWVRHSDAQAALQSKDEQIERPTQELREKSSEADRGAQGFAFHAGSAEREREGWLAAAQQVQKLTQERDSLLQGLRILNVDGARLAGLVQKLTAEKERLREALTPSGDTKAAYIGEFYERVVIANPMFEGNEDDEPETIIQSVPVSWTTIKEIMAAIRARSALTQEGER